MDDEMEEKRDKVRKRLERRAAGLPSLFYSEAQAIAEAAGYVLRSGADQGEPYTLWNREPEFASKNLRALALWIEERMQLKEALRVQRAKRALSMSEKLRAAGIQKRKPSGQGYAIGVGGKARKPRQ